MSTIVVFDCARGTTTERDMTTEEETTHLRQQAEAQAAEAGRQAARETVIAQRDADMALIQQHPALPDDLKAALARLLQPRGLPYGRV